MSGELWIELVVIPLLLIAAGFLAAAEAALGAASRPRIHQLAQDGHARAAVAKRLQEERDLTAAALRLGRNLASIGVATLATSVLIAVYGEIGIAYAALAVTVLVLIFSDVVPRSFAGAQADAAALALARPARLA